MSMVCGPPNSYIAVSWLRDGTMSVEQDGRSSRLVQGWLAICDSVRPFEYGITPCPKDYCSLWPIKPFPAGSAESKGSAACAPELTILSAALAASLALPTAGTPSPTFYADQFFGRRAVDAFRITASGWSLRQA